METEKLFEDFLNAKLEEGSSIEKAFYAEKDVAWLRTRLLSKRPIVFMNASDNFLLRDGETGGYGGWDTIGSDSEEEPLVLRDYLSYDEIALGAVCGVSCETYAINKGDRMNRGIKSDDHETSGIYVGLVGPRFERPGAMEYEQIIVDDTRPAKETQLQKAWAQFYGIDRFPTLKDVKRGDKRFINTDDDEYFDALVYKRRIAITAKTFLLEANERAKTANKKAYAHVVGLGLGLWQIHEAQDDLFVDAWEDVLKALPLPHVSDVDFSHIKPRQAKTITVAENSVNVHFSKRAPFEKLHDPNKLLVASFAWDANAYPGNEYWLGSLDGSGDPAAAACSAIGELLNPDINPAALHGSRTRLY